MDFNKLLFIDIETVSSVAQYDELSAPMQELWRKKAKQLRATTDEECTEAFIARAGIFAEFGKVVAIALGCVQQDAAGKRSLHIKGLADKDEKTLLTSFTELLGKLPGRHFVGHNIKEFDLPYLSRRMLVQGIPLPRVLDMRGKKPWEVHHVDTMELWKFGDRKNYTSLALLCALFGISSSKKDMDGSEVGPCYYQQGDLPRISTYCQQDVVATTQLFLKLHTQPQLEERDVSFS